MLNYQVPSGLRTYQIFLCALIFCAINFTACKNDPYTSLNQHDANAQVFTIELFQNTAINSISISTLDKTPLYILKKNDIDMAPVFAGLEIVFTELENGISIFSDNVDTVSYQDINIVDQNGNFLLKPFEIHTDTGRTILIRGLLTVSNVRGSIILNADCYEHDIIASMMAEIVKKNDPQPFQEALSVLLRTNLYAFDGGEPIHESERIGIVLGSESPQKYHYDVIHTTKGYIAVSHNKPVVLYSTEICGGMTATPDMVWQDLPSKPSYQVVLCENCLSTGSYEWIKVVNSHDLGNLLFGSFNHVKVWISKFYENGRPQFITAQMGENKKTYTVEEFRKQIAQGDVSGIILSDWFQIKDSDDALEKEHPLQSLNINYSNMAPESEEVLFIGWGIGHGVGLCRESARLQARNGKTFPEILRYYFPQLRTIRIESE